MKTYEIKFTSEVFVVVEADNVDDAENQAIEHLKGLTGADWRENIYMTDIDSVDEWVVHTEPMSK